MPNEKRSKESERPMGEGRNSFDSTDMPLRAEDAQPDERTLKGTDSEEKRRAREDEERRRSK